MRPSPFCIAIALSLLTAADARAQMQYCAPLNQAAPQTQQPLTVFLEPLPAEQLAPIVEHPHVHGVLASEFGFLYLRPHWERDDFAMLVPGANPFPNLGDINELHEDFTFAPRVQLAYMLPNSEFGVSASGYLLALSGSLTRSFGASAVTAKANSEVKIFTANLVEFYVSAPLAELGLLGGVCSCCHEGFAENTLVTLSMGFRHSSLTQEYSASLQSATVTSAITSNQTFEGQGLTSEINFQRVKADGLATYFRLRGSLLYGTDHRTATANFNDPAAPATNVNSNVIEKETILLPVGELEVGLVWARLVGKWGAPGAVQEARFWVRTGFLAQAWGGAGMLSALENPPEFHDGHFFLYGVSIGAGLEF